MRDLAYASTLIQGAERIRSQPDLPSLLSAVAAEAATLIDADAVAVLRFDGIRRRVIDVHVPNHVDDPTFLDAVRAAGQERWLVQPGSTADLADDVRWTTREAPLSAVSWRSVLAVGLASPSTQVQISLLWLSCSPGAFSGSAAVADLFHGLVNQVLEDLDQRVNLSLAIAARHRIGQAQGVLMARYHVSADQAFQILRCESQKTNVKLRNIADRIIGEFS